MGITRPQRDERGATSIAEIVLVAPALLLALMSIVQGGLYFHARNVAEQAAQEGAATARRFDGNADTARTDTLDFLGTLNDQTLKGREVQVERTAENATVVVRGTVISLIPGLRLSIEETASGPVERYVPPQETP